MICCKIADLEKYAVSRNLKDAVRYVLKNDLRSLPLGKTVVDGDRIFINKVCAETKTPDLLQYEEHHKYIDIQIDVDGDETIYMLYTGATCTQPFDETGDCALYAAKRPDVVCHMNEERCVLCFPYELHMPCVKASCDKVTKCIVKVLADGQ